MDESFADTCSFGCIGVRGKSCQPFFKHVDSKRIITSDQDVNPEIVFETIDSMGVGNVLRDQHIFSILYFGVFTNHLYSPPTGSICRLQDP